MLEKTYKPEDFESKYQDQWEKAGYFACDPKSDKKPYTILMPPPNVTGSLHMGHALTFTIQDILMRYNRMKGCDALWQPGMDHAGIATQMVVERELEKSGVKRTDLGREAFVKKVWEWKEHSGGMIMKQMRRLGAGADWSRERFTLDEGLSQSVKQVFVRLYKDGLIYRDKRLVNWDPKFQTAISDLEVDQKPVTGKFYHLRYPFVEGEGAMVVATTRPETMFGDQAIAVNPDDDRYTHLIGKHVHLPLTGRTIPIIADEHSDPEKGTGAVKITPAHDFNDFEVCKRHDLELMNIMDAYGHLNDQVPESYQGMERFAARKQVIADLEAEGLVEKIEDKEQVVPYGDRSGVVIEPWLTDQWFVDAEKLAGPALEVVEQGKIKFVPESWTKTYYNWMRNIEPWCISRQLWWGHRIPAWFGPDGQIFVADNAEEAQTQATAHYGEVVLLTQETDVLDTWFSSALWPFSTLGWPDDTQDLDRYFPTDTLVTGPDIIFFWVARMVMMTLYFQNDVPFKTVYLNAIVRDEKGQKMSKSKGNVVDPLEVMDKYGADAFRFNLAASAIQGRDVKLSESVVETYRNFVTKLWNASRFCQMNEAKVSESFDPMAVEQPVNRWILAHLNQCTAKVTDALDQYRFNEAALEMLHFVRDKFCDWYLEFTKPLYAQDSEAVTQELQQTSGYVLRSVMHLLHPIMPYVTEELMQNMELGSKESLVISKWPEVMPGLNESFAEASDAIDWLMDVVVKIRAARAEMNVPPGPFVPVEVRGASEQTLKRLQDHDALLKKLARIEALKILGNGDMPPENALQCVIGEVTLYIPLTGLVDFAKEKERLQKAMDKITAEVEKLDKRLNNEAFVAKAPEAVVAEQRAQRAQLIEERGKFETAFERVAALS